MVKMQLWIHEQQHYSIILIYDLEPECYFQIYFFKL